MRRGARARWLGLALSLVLAIAVTSGCDRKEEVAERAPRVGDVAGGLVVARVGGLAVTADQVRETAKTRRIDVRAALDALVDDALAASSVTARGLDRSPAVRRAIDAALARQVVRRLRAQAIAAGPVSDAELAELTRAHWKDVALPERVRVVHAIVLRPKDATPDALARARRTAEALHERVASARDLDAFELAAKSAENGGFELRTERLPPFAPDGRITDRDTEGSMDETFATAAFALPANATSGVVETSFGWHVIRVVERMPPEEVSAARRREMFFDECVAQRARRAYVALVDGLEKSKPPTIESYAEAALASSPLELSQVGVGAGVAPQPGAGPR